MNLREQKTFKFTFLFDWLGTELIVVGNRFGI